MPFSTTSLASLAQQLRDGKLSAAALMQHCSDQYQRTESTFHAYQYWHGDPALELASVIDELFRQGRDLGPLMGLPVSVKDLFGVPNMPIVAGTKQALPAQHQHAGPVITQLQKQLALITGKTHTVEFAFGGIGINDHWPTPVNPWSPPDAPCVPGGSSSGAGVSLLQGSALLALGSDTAGSVRIPAAFTGTTALKLSSARWPTQGMIPLSHTLDTPGLLARSIADLSFAFRAIDPALTHQAAPSSVDVPLRSLRIGIPQRFFWDDTSDDVATSVQATLHQLERLGASLVPVEVPHCEAAYEMFQAGGISATELAAFLQRELPQCLPWLGDKVKMRIEDADNLPGTEYLHRLHTLHRMAQAVLPLFDTVDIIATPTVPITAPSVLDLTPEHAYRRANMQALRNTCIANLMNLTAISMPTGLDTRAMPIGLQLMAPPHREYRLLDIALKIESLIGKPHERLGRLPSFA